MAILRANEIRKLGSKELNKRLMELKLEMAKERANVSIGATAASPGRISELRKTVARINTLRREEEGK